MCACLMLENAFVLDSSRYPFYDDHRAAGAKEEVGVDEDDFALYPFFCLIQDGRPRTLGRGAREEVKFELRRRQYENGSHLINITCLSCARFVGGHARNFAHVLRFENLAKSLLVSTWALLAPQVASHR